MRARHGKLKSWKASTSRFLVNVHEAILELAARLFPEPARDLPLFLLLAATVYLLAEHRSYDAPLWLARRMLEGKLYFTQKISWWEMYERHGRFYVGYPPMASILLLPFAALTSETFSQTYASATFYLASAFLLFHLLNTIPELKKAAPAGAFLYLLGTMILHSVREGDVWRLMHGEGNAFLLLALLLSFQKRWPFLAGLAFGIASCCRPLLLFSLPAFLFLFWTYFRKAKKKKGEVKAVAVFFAGAAIPYGVTLPLNHAMTGDALLTPYSAIFRSWGLEAFPFGTQYFFRNLRLYFSTLPLFVPRFPYALFPAEGQSLWFLSPFLIGAVPGIYFARGKLAALTIGAVGIMTPYLFFIGTGMAQYGTRYWTDAFPFLIPLALLGLRPDKEWGRILIAVLGFLSVAINAFAIWAINHA